MIDQSNNIIEILWYLIIYIISGDKIRNVPININNLY